jgi:hypothetical protein
MISNKSQPVPTSHMLKSEIYEPCILAKQTRQPFPDGESKSTGVLELVYMVVCGSLEKRSKGETGSLPPLRMTIASVGGDTH